MRTFSLFISLLCFFFAVQAQDSTYNEYLNQGKLPQTRAKSFDWKERFYFGAGGGIYLLSGQLEGFIPLVSMAPRLNLKEYTDNRSLSIASNAGFILQFGSLGNFTALYLPMMVEYNIGHLATRDADFPVGLSLGLGAEYFGGNFVGDKVRHWAGIGSAGVYFNLGGRSYYVRASKSLTYSNGVNTTFLSLGNMF
jgi:hypothetical protein